MRILDYLEYSVSPTTKFIICLLIALALFVVYLWEPERKKKKRKKVEQRPQGFLNYIEIDPKTLEGDAELLKPSDRVTQISGNDVTLNHLDEYIKTLREYQINSLDEI